MTAWKTVFAVTIAAAACTGISAAATIEDARRIVDRAEPLHCEIHALEKRQEAAAAGTEESEKVADEIGKARARLKAHYLATMMEYIEVMKMLPFDERKKVYAYSSAVAERCAAKANVNIRPE